MNRRKLIQTTAVAGTALVFAQKTGAAEADMLKTDDPIAVALNYMEDATMVDPEKHPKKAGPGGAAQNCASCALYSEVADGAGTCTAIPGKLVLGAGWCSAWVGRS